MRHSEQPVDVVAPLLHGLRRCRGARGWRSNSLVSDSAVGAVLDGVRDACAGVCYCMACTVAVPESGRSGARGAEDATSCSITKSSEVSAWCSMIRTIMLSEKTSKNLKPSPLPGAPNVGEEISLAGWRIAPALNSEERRGLSVLLATRLVDQHTRAHEGLEWFGPPKRNTLLHYVMYCLELV
jgi:ferredoxin